MCVSGGGETACDKALQTICNYYYDLITLSFSFLNYEKKLMMVSVRYS